MKNLDAKKRMYAGMLESARSLGGEDLRSRYGKKKEEPAPAPTECEECTDEEKCAAHAAPAEAEGAGEEPEGETDESGAIVIRISK